MRLYHGSNLVVKEPMIMHREHPCDFGDAFYLTSSLDQARRWAQIKARRGGDGEPIVSIFELPEESLKHLVVREFARADASWLRYVVAHRTGRAKDEGTDIVIGPVANDRTASVISFYQSGVYTLSYAIKRLLPQKLDDQYAIKSASGLAALRFVGSEQL